MGRPCTVCERPELERQLIDREIVAGGHYRDIARRHSLGKDAVMRHRSHISAALARMEAVKEQAEAHQAEDLLAYVQELIDESRSALADAKRSGAGGLRLGAIRELRASVELRGRATGELKDGGTTVQVLNVMASPEMQAIIGVILQELRDHPDVRDRLAQRLFQLEQPVLRGAVA